MIDTLTQVMDKILSSKKHEFCISNYLLALKIAKTENKPYKVFMEIAKAYLISQARIIKETNKLSYDVGAYGLSKKSQPSQQWRK